jgi:ABC-type uncharacterized transport system involved in gliding motility auxiliary subunit
MKTLRLLAAAACILIIALCATMILNRVLGSTRLDLTEQKMYSLSEGTKNILDKLNQPVHLRLYYSRTAAMTGPEGIRYWNVYYLHVRDLLREYIDASNDKLTLEIIDPRTWTDEEQEATESGLKRIPIDRAGDKAFFFGLVARTELGKEKVIPFFAPRRQEFVEYDISKLISDVIRRDKKKLGVLSSLPVMGPDMSPYMMQMMRMQGRMPPPPWAITQALEDQYEVEKIATDVRDLPDDLDYLMVVHPKDLSERTLFAIDQFVMNGGGLIVFVDPHCLNDQPAMPNPMMRQQHKRNSNLNALLQAWGVEQIDGAIAADRRLGLTVSLPGDRTGKLPVFLGLDQSCVNEEEVIVAQLEQVTMRFPGVLQKVPGTASSVVPLLRTTAEGGVWKPENPFELQMPDPDKMRRDLRGREEKILGFRITGKLKTNFPDGILVDDDKDENGENEDEKNDDGGDEDQETEDAEKESGPKRLEAVKQSEEDVTVLVFADVDMISDDLAYQDTFWGKDAVGDNAPLVQNAVDFLGGDHDLISIRGRGQFNRPFEVVDDIVHEVNQEIGEQVQRVQGQIKEYQQQLDKLRRSANTENIDLVQSAALQEQRKLEEQLREAKREERQLRRRRRDAIEDLKFWLQFHNMLWVPLGLVLAFVGLIAYRYGRARYYTNRYASRRSPE